ncbi:MAG: ATP-binding cassette domain-containing protein [Pseudomonadales bacterium]|nr:ATP-binding cassette domain-containing protein [Pseudomonadales bacterium]
MNPLALHLKQIRIDLHDEQLIALDAVIEPGEILTVMGPSGSGKSTLLAYLAGFLAPVFKASGEIILHERRLDKLPAEQRRIGLLFQDPLLFPHLSVGGNLRFALPPTVSNRKTVIASGLATMGLDGYAERDPATLSGGQRARVALLRLLLSKPEAVLLDEPFSKLDAHLRKEIRQQVFTSLQQAGLPGVLVTHDAEDAAAAGGRIITLSSADD